MSDPVSPTTALQAIMAASGHTEPDAALILRHLRAAGWVLVRADVVEGATDSLREHMRLLKSSREETAAVRKMSIAMEDLARKLGFYEARDRAVAICLRKAQASEEDDLTPIEEAIREQLIFASREIRELQPKGKGTEA